MAETPTGIAGTEHHPAPATASTCHVCHCEIESPYALAAVRGVGVAALCSPECAAALSKADPIVELVHLRAWVLRMSYEVESIGELPARKRGPEAARLAERMRNAVSAPGWWKRAGDPTQPRRNRND